MAVRKLDNIKFEDLRGFDKSAILLNYLGQDAAKQLLKHIEDNDIRKLMGIMGRYRVVPVEVTKRVLEEYYEMLNEATDYIFSDELTKKENLVEAVGEERARTIFGHLSVGGGKNQSLEALDVVDTKSLANFLLNEHPQTIAVILSHLEPERKGEALKRLPDSLQAEVVLRMAHLEYVDPELVAEINKVLKEELATNATVERTQLGGVQPVAEMLNVMDKNTESSIMSRLEEKDALLAEEIRKLMFVFEDIVKIDDKGIQSLLKEIPNDKLLLALKTANDDIKAKVFKNISARAAQLLKEDLESMGPSRLSDVEGAQQTIVATARKLEQEGKIIIARGGTEDALV